MGVPFKANQQGINRINLGVESFDDEVLRIMGRRHSSVETLRALELIIENGYSNVNVTQVQVISATLTP